MATLRVGTVTQQTWDDTLNGLINLSRSTLAQNLDYETRVAELEAQIVALNRQISTVYPVNENNTLVLCIINGENTFFEKSLVQRGFAGGRTAAQHLTRTLSDLFSEGGVHNIFGRVSFWATLYLRKTDLINTFVNKQLCSVNQLESFLAGFTQASPRFTTVDVGYGGDGTDVKIREYLQTFTRFTQTFRVFIAGCHGANFFPVFDALESEGLLGKLIALQSPNEKSLAENQVHPLPSVPTEGLFPLRDLQTGVIKRSPIPVGSSNTVSLDAGLISPQSPARGDRQLINSKLPFHKLFLGGPPPCNEYYLMTCSKGRGVCKYSHDFVLNPEQLASLASSAKKAPCNWLKNGMRCPYGDKCCWGHVCPNGPNCSHLSRGRCWFRGEGMHDHSC